MTPSGRFAVPADHPALPGHFPGRPIVPGVMLLDRVIEALSEGRPVLGVPSVKFTHPVRPGSAVEIFRTEASDGRVAFRCVAEGAEVARGTLLFGMA